MSKDRIYNYEWKDNFIKGYYTKDDGNLDSVRRVFDQVGDYERKINKDVCCFTEGELIAMFEEFDWATYHNFGRNKAILKSYIKWVKEQVSDVFKTDVFKEFKFQNITGESFFNKKYFKDFDELKECIDTVSNAGHQDQFLMTRTILYLLWIGFNIDEICKIESENILNELRKKECYDQEIYYTCLKCSKKTFYQTKGNRNSKAKRKFNSNIYLLKKTVNNKVNPNKPIDEVYIMTDMIRNFNNITCFLENTNKFYKKSITISTVFDSGLYSRIFEYETRVGIIKQPLDLKGFFKTENKDVSNTVRSATFHDYKKWKRYFYE